jgi:hypothetical protein
MMFWFRRTSPAGGSQFNLANNTYDMLFWWLQGGDGYSFPGAQVVLPAGDPYVDVVMADLKRHPEGVRAQPLA